MPEGSPLRVNYGPDELRPLLAEAGVDKTVIVQAHASVEETKWCLEIAENTDFVAGVVGWVDLSEPNVGEILDDLQQSPYFKGVRHLWEMDEDHGWLAGDAPINGLKEIEQRGLCYDFLVRPWNLPFVPRIMEHVPNLRAVIDHIAKPNIKEREVEPWLTRLRDVASIDGMRCKLSGMTTEADMENWTNSDLTLRPPCRRHVRCRPDHVRLRLARIHARHNLSRMGGSRARHAQKPPGRASRLHIRQHRNRVLQTRCLRSRFRPETHLIQ